MRLPCITAITAVGVASLAAPAAIAIPGGSGFTPPSNARPLSAKLARFISRDSVKDTAQLLDDHVAGRRCWSHERVTLCDVRLKGGQPLTIRLSAWNDGYGDVTVSGRIR